MNPGPGVPAGAAVLRTPRILGLLLALLASIAPIALGQEWPKPFGDASRLAMACLPWVVVAGWPSREGVRRDWPLALGLALPVWALAGWLDLRLGLGAVRLQSSVAAAFVMTACLGEARTQASRRNPTPYALLWLLCLGILPAVALALSWGRGEPVTDEGIAGALRGFSPVASIWRDVQPVEGDLARRGIDSALFCPATLVCVVLALVFGLAGRRRPGGGIR